MMAKFAALALFVLTLWQLSDAQAPPQCATLNVDNPLQSPAVGSNLPVCTTDRLQCCAREYIDDVTERARQRLIDGLREEFQDRIEDYERIVQQLMQYFTGDFEDAFRSSLPLASFIPDQQLRSAVTNLIQNFERNVMITRGLTYNISAFLQNVTIGLENLAAQILGSGNMTRRMCIVNFIQRRINQTAVSLVGRGLGQIRRGVTTAVRILVFLQNYNLTLGNFQPLQRCRERLVELSFCSRCTRRIPPLCSNTCGALIRACYSPFVDGLRGEFNNLWDITRQVVRATNNTLMQIFSEENPIFMFDLSTDVLQLSRACGVSSLLGRRRRENGNIPLLPARVMDRLNALRGVFEYDDDGPEICEPDSDFLTCTGDDDDRTCGRRDVCTAACNCWNGTTNRTTNTQRFINSNIEGQVDNPVIQLDVQQLMTQASALGTPVNTFLTNDNFTEVSPEGVTAPPAAPFDGSGGAATVVSLTMMLAAVLLATTM